MNWQEVENIISEYPKSPLVQAINFEELYRIAIVHHSSAIEGSTLSLIETQLLLQEGTTAKGKPLEHHLMVQDHYEALKYVLDASKQKVKITGSFIQKINSLVMKRTGGIVNAAAGSFDTSKGDLRLVRVTAGDTFFVNYQKVPKMLDDLCNDIDSKIKKSSSLKDIIQLSFDAHFHLVSIHPFGDGNGRTSRLLMNFIQSYHSLPLSIVFSEDKKDYFEALKKTRETEDINIFREFMSSQYFKYLSSELEKFKKQDGNVSFLK